MEKAAHLVSETATKVKEKMGMGSHVPSDQLTTMSGCPVSHNKNSLSAGPHGPGLLQDTFLLEKLQQFDREKIPARNVHALGYGAYGTFTVTHDITKYSCANLFSQVGMKTDIFVRMSGIFTEQGDPDTMRDPRGFAIKFYTKEGNWDLLAINTPVFNVRDAKMGPDAVHAYKRNPRDSFWNPNQTWDYVANHPEGLHQQLMLFSDRGGTPMSFRYMHAYGCNTFSFVNANKERFWVKFHLISHNGAKGFTQEQAKLMAGEDPNWLGRDLKESIENKMYPKWRLCFQIMPEAEGYKHSYTFDCTKVWRHQDYPLIDIGEIELNRNPTDYFTEVEQVAFSPARVVPGIGYSPDKLLQGRLMIYSDTQYHRLGANYLQYYINCPHATRANTNYNVGGHGQSDLRDHFPHYYPSSYGGLKPDAKYMEPSLFTDGPGGYYDYPEEGTDKDYYEQPRILFTKILKEMDKNNLCENIATSLFKCEDMVTSKVMQHLYKIDQQLGSKVDKILAERKQGVKKLTEGEKLVQHLNKTLLMHHA